MSLSSDAIDRIVANVLKQISPGTTLSVPAAVRETPSTKVAEPKQAESVSLPSKVITGNLLEAVPERSVVTVGPKAIVTPSAWDVIRSRHLNLQRGNPDSSKESVRKSVASPANSGVSPLLIVVRSTKQLEQVWETLSGRWKRELLGCPDDAAKLATSELARGSVSQVVILAEQTHRAACLANRNEVTKAVAIHDVGDVKEIRKQIRANVWCVNPGNRSFFELKNLFQQIETPLAR